MTSPEQQRRELKREEERSLLLGPCRLPTSSEGLPASTEGISASSEDYPPLLKDYLPLLKAERESQSMLGAGAGGAKVRRKSIHILTCLTSVTMAHSAVS